MNRKYDEMESLGDIFVTSNQTDIDRSTNLIFKLDGISKQTVLNLSQRRILEGIAINPEQLTIFSILILIST